MIDVSILSALPLLPSLSTVGLSEAPASFVAMTPMIIVNDTFKNFEDGNELCFHLAHEKFHIEQIRHWPVMNGMVWSVLTATLDTDDQRKRVEALEQGRQMLDKVRFLLEGQGVLFLLAQGSWHPDVRTKVIEASLAKGSEHREGLSLFFRRSDVTAASFDDCLTRIKARSKGCRP